MFVILHVKKKSNAGVPGSLSALSRHIRAIFAVVSSSFSSLSSFACTFSLGERDVGLYYWVDDGYAWVTTSDVTTSDKCVLMTMRDVGLY